MKKIQAGVRVIFLLEKPKSLWSLIAIQCSLIHLDYHLNILGGKGRGGLRDSEEPPSGKLL